MASLDLFDDCLDLACFSLKDLVFVVDSLDRLVGRNLDDIQPIDLLKLFCFGEGISVSFNLNNVFDVEYATNTFGRQIVPSIGRNYTIALSYNLK